MRRVFPHAKIRRPKGKIILPYLTMKRFFKLKSLPGLGSESVIFWLFSFFISHFTNEQQRLHRKYFFKFKSLPRLGSESWIFWLFFYSSSLILPMSYSGSTENIFLKLKSLPRLRNESWIFWLFFYSSSLILPMSCSGFTENIFLKF